MIRKGSQCNETMMRFSSPEYKLGRGMGHVKRALPMGGMMSAPTRYDCMYEGPARMKMGKVRKPMQFENIGTRNTGGTFFN